MLHHSNQATTCTLFHRRPFLSLLRLIFNWTMDNRCFSQTSSIILRSMKTYLPISRATSKNNESYFRRQMIIHRDMFIHINPRANSSSFFLCKVHQAKITHQILSFSTLKTFNWWRCKIICCSSSSCNSSTINSQCRDIIPKWTNSEKVCKKWILEVHTPAEEMSERKGTTLFREVTVEDVLKNNLDHLNPLACWTNKG